MPRMRCPRCSTLVDVAAGAAPVCPACGFGSTSASTPPSAAVAAPVASSPPAPAAAAAGAPGAGRRKVLVLVAVGVLVLAGAAAATAWVLLGGPAGHALSDEEARSRVAASLQAATGAFTGEASGDDLAKMEASVTPPAEGSSADSGSNPFLGGLRSMHLVMEWGKDGARRVQLEASSGPVTLSMVLTCTKERRAIEYSGEAYVSRPYVDGVQDCMDVGGGDDGGEGLENGTAPSLDELRAEDAQITVGDDGTIHAVVEKDDQRAELDLDSKGRLSKLTATSPGEGSWTMTYTYGSRRTIDLPKDAKPMPAEVMAVPDFDDGQDSGDTQHWTVDSSPQEPPLSEMEVRVTEGYGAFDDGASSHPQATFRLEGGHQVQGNFTFDYTDTDGDGKVSAGDTYELTDSALADDPDDPFDFSFPDYQVVLYDEVAQGVVNSSPLGAPGLGWLAIAGLALAGAALRRR